MFVYYSHGYLHLLTRLMHRRVFSARDNYPSLFSSRRPSESYAVLDLLCSSHPRKRDRLW